MNNYFSMNENEDGSRICNFPPIGGKFSPYNWLIANAVWTIYHTTQKMYQEDMKNNDTFGDNAFRYFCTDEDTKYIDNAVAEIHKAAKAYSPEEEEKVG